MTSARILIIDDEPDMLENCRRLLDQSGYTPRTLQDPTRLREVMPEFEPDVLLLDLRMPKADGMTVLAAALAEDATLPIVIMTAFATVASAVQAIREGAFDYLAKPFTRDQLLVTVQRAVRYRGLARENRRLRARVRQESGDREILGSSPAIIRMLEQIRKVAPTDANVLITGESGSGKELVALAIHKQSTRRGPFVPLDCASVPENLLESELFGHERGAFTGAITKKTGLLVEANGGTVFLDEVAELDLSLQSRLLRVLEERTVRPVGGTAMIATDIRLVAATNVALDAAVAAGRFRQDLFFRLNVIHLEVPPLRSRTGDIPLLLHTFLERFTGDTERPVPRVSPEALAVLEAHSWPGNVRELRNLAHRLVVLDMDGRITLSDLPDVVRGWDDASEREPTPPPAYERARDKALLAFRRGYVRRILEYHGGNVTRAAEAAGVSRRTLHRWIAEDAETDGSGTI